MKVTYSTTRKYLAEKMLAYYLDSEPFTILDATPISTKKKNLINL